MNEQTDGEPAIFAWAGKAAMLGLALLMVGRLGGVTPAGDVGAALLILAAALGIGGGWWAGRAPAETRFDVRDRVVRGLVGTRITTAAGTVTVVDDSASGGDRRRRSVVAVDEKGQAGMLFVELDRRGRVTAAALPGAEFTPATVV